MADTYTQIYVHIVFSVQGFENLIKEQFRDELEKYICGIISNKNSKPLSIYCNPDHVHIFLGLNPLISISELCRDIKANSSKWINNKNMVTGKFNWQAGYGAFTYSKSQIANVCKYILNQPEHHKKVTFKDEYIKLLKEFEIKYDEKYLFEWLL